ncbi:uncharacterized protein K460DRAFT_56180 [Cucurbitaria berberidis CBS 394.84]|uniref:Uncharacterized protein n=1 Tax=Cucurbitaria berberidis CBS 394.84 TaxID=1168544 RepID=A0A9P4GLH6_9PLEO|nr:uncharacterized protein K460DRAFT_56180 [Cucurbitaria berberidis CBS 394.84]KAF1847271.1 hypothetical protein K460DRAFT_56180 [Cucurbitaria berberidis CBS 394.84]
MQRIVRMLWARTAEEGSRTIIHAVIADESTHGKHLSGCEVKEHWISPSMTDAEGQRTQKQIWKELAALMESAHPGCAPRIS